MGKLFKAIRQQLSSMYEDEESQAISFILLEDVCGLSKADVLMNRDDELDSLKMAKIQDCMTRLLNHEPIQYVVGKTSFFGLEIMVSDGVLIPRPETEELIMAVRDSNPKSVLDIGTGSGCIALALKSVFPEADVYAYDISDKALEIARRNAAQLNLNVTFMNADILKLRSSQRQFDLIVSNPPYICESERQDMDCNVLDYEPSIALFVPDNDPLRFYRAIVDFASSSLTDGGMLAFEINRMYGADVKMLMERNRFVGVNVCKDQFGNDRIVTGWLQRK